jgi:hypothetical protein
MNLTVWVYASTLTYPEGGGHFWVYLNWALGLRSLGCRVVWLEGCDPRMQAHSIRPKLAGLRNRLQPYGFDQSIALCSASDEQELSVDATASCVSLEEAAHADLLLNLAYAGCGSAIRRFRRTAMIDLDPGLLQTWVTNRQMRLPRHDIFFTIGETVGRSGNIPDLDIAWRYTPPCVALDWWPVCPAPADAPFTTVSHWRASEWFFMDGEQRRNDKRAGFLPYLDVPHRTTQRMELALCLRADEELRLHADEEEERQVLLQHGWEVRHSHAVAKTPWDYQRYIQRSRGEFSCAKPSCVYLQNAWVSDRTICYLASGKPAVVQHTGPSRSLPDAGGLFRFRDPDEAVRCLELVAANYEQECRNARRLAEERFDARHVARRVLEDSMACKAA